MRRTSSPGINIRAGLCLSLAFAPAACVSISPTSVSDPIREYNASFKRTFAAVVKTAADLKAPVDTYLKESGLLTLGRITAPPEWIDCLDREDAYPQVAQLLISIRRISRGLTQVTVETVLWENYRAQWDLSSGEVPHPYKECHSTGRVEDLVFDGIATNLQPR